MSEAQRERLRSKIHLQYAFAPPPSVMGLGSTASQVYGDLTRVIDPSLWMLKGQSQKEAKGHPGHTSHCPICITRPPLGQVAPKGLWASLWVQVRGPFGPIRLFS